VSGQQLEQTADENISVLKSQMEASRRAEAEARAEAAAAKKAAEGQVAARVAADEAAIRSTIAAAEAARAAAEADYAKAIENADFAAAAKANSRLTDATVAMREYQQRDASLQNWKKQETARLAEEGRRQPQPSQGDAAGQYSPETQAWLSKHNIRLDPNDRTFKKAVAGHFDAVAEGYEPDTKEYFDYIEEYAGLNGGGQNGEGRQEQPARRGSRQPAPDSPLSQAADTNAMEIDLAIEPEPEQRRSVDQRIVREEPPVRQAASRAMPSLPPSRQSPSPTGRERPGVVRLTVGEQEIARKSWPHLPADQAYREYATNKRALQEEGRL